MKTANLTVFFQTSNPEQLVIKQFIIKMNLSQALLTISKIKIPKTISMSFNLTIRSTVHFIAKLMKKPMFLKVKIKEKEILS